MRGSARRALSVRRQPEAKSRSGAKTPSAEFQLFVDVYLSSCPLCRREVNRSWQRMLCSRACTFCHPSMQPGPLIGPVCSLPNDKQRPTVWALWRKRIYCWSTSVRCHFRLDNIRWWAIFEPTDVHRNFAAGFESCTFSLSDG